MKKNKIISFVLLFLGVVLAVLIAKKDTYHTEIVLNDGDFIPFYDLERKKELSQEFTCAVNNLEGIHIKLGTYGKKIVGRTVKLVIKDEEGKVLRESSISSTDIIDSGYNMFSFPKIQDSIRKNYSLEIDCVDCTNSEKIAVYGEEANIGSNSAQIKNVGYPYKLSFAVIGDSYFKPWIEGVTILFLVLSFALVYINREAILKKYPIIEKYTNKNFLFYFIEFLVTFLTLFFLCKFLYYLNYQYIFNLPSYFLLVLFSCLLLFQIALKLCKTIKIEHLFLLLVIPFGLSYLVFMMPTKVADEIAHYASSYNFSQGNFFYSSETVLIPEQIAANNNKLLNNYEQLFQLLKAPNNNQLVDNNKSGYIILGYFPATIGLVISNFLHLPVFLGFYIARFFTFLTSTLLLLLAIKKIPIGKMLLCIYALSPMYLHQATSITLDALLNAYCLLFLAFVLYLNRKKQAIDKKEKIILFLLLIAIAGLKYVYIPFAFLLLLPLGKKEVNKKDKMLFIMLIFIAFLVCASIFLSHTIINIRSNAVTTDVVGVSVSHQIVYLLKNPLKIIEVLGDTLKQDGLFYFESLWGAYLGWLDLDINHIVIYLYFSLLLITPFLEKNQEQLTKKEKIFLLGTGFIIFLAVIFGMYLTWTTVGGKVVLGVQGRYFIPIAILPILLLCKKENYLDFKNNALMCSVILFIIHFQTISTIIETFI